jgi:hypothetical protein
MPKSQKVRLKINTAVKNSLIKSFSPGGNLQKMVDMEVARLSDPYAPSDTGALRKSVFVNSAFGSGEINYTIYGDRNGRNTWNDDTSKFQDRPMRGNRWVQRAMDNGGREKLMLAISKFIDRNKK